MEEPSSGARQADTETALRFPQWYCLLMRVIITTFNWLSLHSENRHTSCGQVGGAEWSRSPRGSQYGATDLAENDIGPVTEVHLWQPGNGLGEAPVHRSTRQKRRYTVRNRNRLLRHDCTPNLRWRQGGTPGPLTRWRLLSGAVVHRPRLRGGRGAATAGSLSPGEGSSADSQPSRWGEGERQADRFL